MEAVAEHELSVDPLLAPGLRPRARLRLPDRARRLARAARRRRRRRCSPPTTGSSGPRRDPTRCPTIRGHLGEPHRPPVDARRPHRRADLRPGLDRRASSAWRTSSWPTWAAPPTAAHRAPWRRSDDLAHVATVPCPGARARRRRSWRCCCSSPPTAQRAAHVRRHLPGRRSGPSAWRPPSPASASPCWLLRAGHRRRVLGRAARRPRARGRHTPAGVDADHHAHALAGDQARSSRDSPRWPRSAC